jgi:Fe2+ or Zn2+ uptake regulation protein
MSLKTNAMKKYTTKELKAELEGAGIRATAQRVAILGFMRENPVHPTADVVYEALRDNVGSLSLTTVYNTLKLFVEHSLVSMLTIDDTFRCFDGNVEMHVHLMCRNCKKIMDMPMPKEVATFVEDIENFKVDEAQLYVKGICKDCN